MMVVHVEDQSIGPEEYADQAEHTHREEMLQEPKIVQAEQACMEEMCRESIPQTDPVTETKLRRIPTYVNHAEHHRKAPETKPRSNNNSANRAEHQTMEVEQDEQVGSHEPVCNIDRLSGPDNGLGMTEKAASVYKLSVREGIAKPNCETDQAEQLSGPENGPGMTKKAATVYKLDVRERLVKSNCEADQAEQLTGPKNGPGMTKKAATVYELVCGKLW